MQTTLDIVDHRCSLAYICDPFRLMNQTPKISETEWEIMQVLWKHSPDTSSGILERLRVQDQTWHPKTLRTLLTRLVRKKALSYQASGRSYLFQPLVTESECRAVASNDFLDRIFGGSLQPMLAYFVEQKKVSRKDLEELSALLEGKERKGAKCKPKQ
jgi:BlaI family penicillinase repressor